MTDQRSLASATVSDDYAADYYEAYEPGLPYTYEEPHWKAFFGGIADNLIALFAPETSYDAGCAKGFLVRAMAERGVQARGGDISAHAIENAPPGLIELLEVKDLTEAFAERYDLISCIEVLEHMSAHDAQLAVTNLCAASDLVVLSTTPDDFAEPTHINIRTQAEWAKDFARHGFFRRTDVDASFIAPWAVVFERSRSTVVELVGAYETLLAPLGREVVAKRRALLEAQRDLNEARSSTNGAMAKALEGHDAVVAQHNGLLAERDRLLAHIENLGLADLQAERMNRLAMADQIVGLNAELAQLKIHSENTIAEAGRDAIRLQEVVHGLGTELAQAQAQLDEARRVVAEVTASTTWRIGRIAMFPVRLVRLPRRLLRALARRAIGRLR